MSYEVVYDNKFYDYCDEKYPKIPHILPAPKKIVVFGDIHGDLELAKKLLKLAGVIDDNLNWIGGDTIVVQVGDQIDRCRPLEKGDCSKPNYTKNDENSDLDILELFSVLDKKARKENGYVISLLGNHEINNVLGRMSYVSYKGIIDYKDEINMKTGNLIREEQDFTGTDFEIGRQVRRFLFKRGNKIGKFLGCTRQSVIKIGSYLFVHASIIDNFANTFPDDKGIKNFNILIREWLLKKKDSNEVIKGTNFSLKDLLLNNNISPFLPRNLGYLPSKLKRESKKCKKEIDNIFQTYNIKGIIVGHTPKLEEGISLTCINKDKSSFIARVDNGSSHAFDIFANNEKKKKNRKAQALLIENNGEKISIIKKKN